MSEDAKRRLEKAQKKIMEKTEIIKLSRLGLRSAFGLGMPLRDRIFEKQGQLMENLKQRFNPPQKRMVPERFQNPQITHQKQPQIVQHNIPTPRMPIRAGVGDVLKSVSKRVEGAEPERQREIPAPPRERPKEHPSRDERTFMPELAVVMDNWKSFSVEQKRKKKSSISVEV